MITLGSKVQDTITGFTGIAIGRTEWQYGCARICVQSQELHNGEPIPPQTFDEQQLVVIKEELPVVSPDSSAKSGGPQHDPSPGRE